MAEFHFSRRIDEAETRNWEERVRIGRATLRKMEARWDESIRRYANRHLPQVVSGDGPNVSVNVLLSNVRSKLPYLFFQQPELLVRSRRPNTPIDQPAIVKSLLLYFFKQEKMRRKINRCILDGLLQSRGILKVGYSTRTATNTDAPRGDGEPDYGKKKRGRPRKEGSALDQMPPLRILQEGPVCSHVSPRRLFTHPDARFPIDDHANWVCHIGVRPLDLVRTDERLDGSWRRNVKPTEHLKFQAMGFEHTSDMFGGDGSDRDPSSQFVVLYEIWDKIRREVLTFADGNFTLGPARVTKWPFNGMAGFPFIMYVPLEVPETFEAMTELDPIINQVEEMDHFRTMQARHLARFKRFYEVTTDTIDHDELDKLRIREDGDFLISNAQDGRRSVFPVEDASMPIDSFRFIADIRNDIDMVSGVSELRRQGQGNARTATEASIVDQVQQARGVFDRQIVDDFVLETIEKEFMIMQQWLPQDLALEILGPRGADWIERVTPAMIEGQFDFEILPGSTVPPNNALLRAEITNIAGIIMSNPMFQNSVDPRELLKAILETFPETIRDGRMEKILRNPEAVTGPIQPQLLGPGQALPGATPGGSEMSPELLELLASAQGGAA